MEPLYYLVSHGLLSARTMPYYLHRYTWYRIEARRNLRLTQLQATQPR